MARKPKRAFLVVWYWTRCCPRQALPCRARCAISDLSARLLYPQRVRDGLHASAKLDVELHGSHAVFVRIHELSPVSPRIRPHLQGISFSFRPTLRLRECLHIVFLGSVRLANSPFEPQERANASNGPMSWLSAARRAAT